MRKERTQTGKIRDKIERVKSSASFVRGKSSAPFVRGYLHQDLVSSPPGLSAVRTGKTENQIGFSIVGADYGKLLQIFYTHNLLKYSNRV